MTKQEALLKFLNIEYDDITPSKYDENLFGCDASEYLVLTDDEANERAKEDIGQSLWAFNASFLNSHFVARIPEKFITKMQEELCEDCNEIFRALIKDFDHFVNDVISADGRGLFLSSYDGKENEEGEFFIYRVN